DDQASGAPPASGTAAPASPPASPPPAPTPPPYPSMGATLSNNANSATFDAGPLGKLTVNGDISGLGFVQDNPGYDLDLRQNKTAGVDLDNGLVTIQKTDGFAQFVIQAGIYSFPALGTAYTTSARTTTDLFGAVPVGYLKIVPNSEWSIEVGQLPTLIGAESPFTYQNMNIERGLLWNQEPLISRGVQVNWSKGPWAVSVSWNDGYYTGEWTSVSGNITYTFKNSDTLVFDASGNASSNFNTCVNNYPFCVAHPYLPANNNGPIGFAVPFGGQSQGQIFNLIYTHTVGKWTFTPYVQYDNVPSTAYFGPGGDSWGVAVLAKYSITSEWSIAGRAEYEGSSGGANLLYGPGSNAWSVTVTPTFQKGIYFARIEGSYVGVGSGTLGDEFGTHGTASSQVRGMLEAGVMF
ncbi:MAG TPA: outer membrane beta-barrel protein, partial [Caulobacteraceae bacterium]|nr:outer membrane beta-barrel protein [Caulobacteraceae bacterium]